MQMDLIPPPPAIDRDYHATEDFFERCDNIREDFRAQFETGTTKSANWPLIPASLAKRVWLDFGRIGFVRNDKAMAKIRDICLDCVARLQVSTELGGHESYSGIELCEFAEDWPEAKQQRFIVFVVDDPDGNWRLSDYGLPQIKALYTEAFCAKTPEQMLYAVDKILNVVHQRGDLASLFIQGGTKTLLEMSTQV